MHNLTQEIVQTIRSTACYLEDCQGSDGMWKDYQLITGESTSWVTSYTGCALLHVKKYGVMHEEVFEDKVLPMIKRAKEALINQETFVAGGWGYNPKLYPDADSTAITIRFLLGANVSVEHPAIKRGLQVIKRSQQENGGCSTYHRGDLKGEQFAGWTQAHLSVTMACIIAWAETKERVISKSDRLQLDAQIKGAIGYLMDQSKHASSLWEDYWWVGPYYPTYIAVSALERFNILDARARDELTAGMLAYQNDDGGFGAMQHQSDCFATALSLNILLTLNRNILGENNRALDALKWLLNQERHGWFPPGAFMRMPTPTFRRREDEENQRITTDVNGIFTTATVLTLLNQVPILTERME